MTKAYLPVNYPVRSYWLAIGNLLNCVEESERLCSRRYYGRTTFEMDYRSSSTTLFEKEPYLLVY